MFSKRLLLALSLLCLFASAPLSAWAQENGGRQFRDDDPPGQPPPPPGQQPPPPPPGQQPPPNEVPPPDTQQPPPQNFGRFYRRAQRISLPRPVLTLRLAGYTGLDESDFMSMYSISAELRALHPFVAEVGFEANPFVLSGFARAGASFYLSRMRSLRTGAGQEITLSVYGGYRFMQIDTGVIDTYHGASLYVGGDYYFWLSRHFGFNFHIGGGIGAWLATTNPNSPIFFPEVRAAFGIAF
ncbi:MAG: hypothetical protein H6728_13220 [Myxococcales bacterium]|nr:hypothetical protein [Myxococcales bacterium]MCB9644030.1 hypothetical protein [Myxococcales bacterium]